MENKGIIENWEYDQRIEWIYIYIRIYMKMPFWSLLVCIIYANVFNILNFCIKWINKINAQVIYDWKVINTPFSLQKYKYVDRLCWVGCYSITLLEIKLCG